MKEFFDQIISSNLIQNFVKYSFTVTDNRKGILQVPMTSRRYILDKKFSIAGQGLFTFYPPPPDMVVGHNEIIMEGIKDMLPDFKRLPRPPTYEPPRHLLYHRYTAALDRMEKEAYDKRVSRRNRKRTRSLEQEVEEEGDRMQSEDEEDEEEKGGDAYLDSNFYSSLFSDQDGSHEGDRMREDVYEGPTPQEAFEQHFYK